MDISPNLHVSVPHVEKLADMPVLVPPIYLLTSMGTIQGGMALGAVLERDIRRCYGSADDAALGHGLMGMIYVGVDSVERNNVGPRVRSFWIMTV
jgi:hypothetical protein